MPTRLGGGGVTHCKIKNYLQKLSQKGSILVEFAIGVPLLLAIAAVMHDLPKYEMMKSKLLFAAHCGINMIQNVSQGRPDPRITKNDVKRIAYAINLPFFTGNQMFRVDATDSLRHPFGHVLVMAIICVKGVENNKVKVMWSAQSCVHNYNGNSIDSIQYIPNNADILNWSKLSYVIGQETTGDSIYPGLQVNKNERKIIFCLCFYTDPKGYKYGDGTRVTIDNAKRLFGFYLLPVKIKSGSNGLFNTVVIFTPKPGLFSETEPPK